MGNLQAIRTNAAMIRTVAQEYGSFGKFVAQWPGDDGVGLWAFLKKHGAQLGGNSGPYFLRTVGKDTFVLTNDVVAVLVAEGIVDKRPSSKKELKAAQEAFNAWKAESGRDLCEISRIVSMNSNAN